VENIENTIPRKWGDATVTKAKHAIRNLKEPKEKKKIRESALKKVVSEVIGKISRTRMMRRGVISLN